LPSDNKTKFHKITVDLAAVEKGHTLGTVYMDGVAVHGVRAIKIESSYQSVTEVTLTMIANVAVEVDGAEVSQE
jgi:hypothetical protein